MARKGMNIYKRKDNRWEGRYKTPSGKYKSVYGKTYGDVRSKLADEKSKSIPPVKRCPLTVRELCESWLDSVKIKVKDSTYANYLNKLNLHVYPVLGGVKYEQLTVADINKLITDKLKCKKRGGGTLSVKYVSDIAVLLKSVGKYGQRECGYKNVMMNITMPKVHKYSPNILSRAEQNTLKRYLLQNRSDMNIAILLCLFTGVRIGELCALKWADIDLFERVVRVNKTLQRTKSFDGKTKTKLAVSLPKSEKSIREIPLPEFLSGILSKIKKNSNCYLCSGTGKVTEPRVVQYRFKRILEIIGVKIVNFHSLRHMFATNCVECGFDAKTLSEILGHSKVEITLNLYTHSSKERKRECMELLLAINN